MIKVIVKNVDYDFEKEDIPSGIEFKNWKEQEEYIEKEKQRLKDQLGNHFEYLFDDNEYNIYEVKDRIEMLDSVANSISDDIGWCCTIEDYEIIKDYEDDEDTQEVIKERGKFKEFYVMHYNPEKGTDSIYEKLEFKTYEEAVKEFNETPIRKEFGMVEIIFSPEDEDYSDNMEVMMKCY